jgi:predicted nucleic acid-binding protein
MSVVYLDTSALLKHYVAETGSLWIDALLTHPDTTAVLSCRLAVVEATCAFARRLREGALSVAQHVRLMEAFRYDCAYYYALLDILPTTIEAACTLASRRP